MTGTGTALDPYIIMTRADLEAVRNDLTAYYELGADIDLSGDPWVPLGWTADYDPDLEDFFSGTFDGKNHRISNMTVTIEQEGMFDMGLFGWVVGTLQNIVLCSATVNVTFTGADGCDVALLCGCLSGGSIYGCQVSGVININGTGIGQDIGGIAGPSSGNITKCRADVIMERFQPSVGYSSQVNFLGGIAGELSDAVSISDCQASLTLVSKTLSPFEATGVGGILGAFRSNGSISNCRATISLVQTPGHWYYSSEYFVGGIVGMSIATNVSDRATVKDCYAVGVLEPYRYAGGIVGSASLIDVVRSGADVDITVFDGQYAGGACGYGGQNTTVGTLTDCYALGKVTLLDNVNTSYYWYGAGFSGSGGTLTRCYSAGLVTPGSALPSTFGGFCPQGPNTVTDCYFDTEASGQTVGLGTGKTTSEMQTQSTFTGWNFSTVWNIASGTYPFLRTAFVTIVDGCAKPVVHSFPWVGRFQLTHVI